MEKNKVIFGQPWGGLGDNLAFSNLPRLYDDIGVKFKVSFLNYSRNNEIFNFVWKRNQHYKGRSFLVPDIGSRISLNPPTVNKKYNVVQKINIKHGFDPGDGYPDINLDYFTFKNSPQNKIVADFSGFSIFNSNQYSYDKNELIDIEKDLVKKGVYFLDYIHLKKHTKGNTNTMNKNTIEINSIDSLVETLSNTEVFICLNSGSHVLASTLKKLIGSPKKIISYYPDFSSDKFLIGNYLFDNVEYKDIKATENKNAATKGKILFYSRLYDYIVN